MHPATDGRGVQQDIGLAGKHAGQATRVRHWHRRAPFSFFPAAR